MRVRYQAIYDELSRAGARDLPEDISDVCKLQILRFRGSTLRSIPSSLPKLRFLRILDLSSTKNLYKLPDSIGNMARLLSLSLSSSSIQSIPCSIKNLHNLEDLDLSHTENLHSLPQEIGDLDSLELLDLRSSHIQSLPSSIGHLKNLKNLDLAETTHLSGLPKEIGDLESLESLSLQDSKAWPLSPCISTMLSHTIACKQGTAKINSGFLVGDQGSVNVIPQAWPLMLTKASCAFSLPDPHPEVCSNFKMPKSDAVYQLLQHCKESFVLLVIDRSTTPGN